MQVYIVNGFPGTGKSLFEDMVSEHMGRCYCKLTSSIDCIKEIARECGWDGTKSEKHRKFLSDLKALLVEWNNYPLQSVKRKISAFECDLEYYGVSEGAAVFIDVREPAEIEKFKKEFNAKTILIRRKEAEQYCHFNNSDRFVLQYEYDIIIENDGTIADLDNIVKEFIRNEKLHNYKNI